MLDVTVYNAYPTVEEAIAALTEAKQDANVSYAPSPLIDEYTARMINSPALDAYLTAENIKIAWKLPQLELSIPNYIGFATVFTPAKPTNILPARSTDGSAGYDFILPYDVRIKPNEIVELHLGVKAYMPENMVLSIYIRSSLSDKLLLINNVGIIDSDYADNPTNHGEIIVKLVLQPWQTEPVILKAGSKIVQGIFTEYKKTTFDLPLKVNSRKGGFGSTTEIEPVIEHRETSIEDAEIAKEETKQWLEKDRFDVKLAQQEQEKEETKKDQGS